MRTTDSTDPAPLLTEQVALPSGGTSDGVTPEAPSALPGTKRIRGSLARLSFWSAALFPVLYVALLLPGTVATRELLLLGLVATHALALLGGRSYLGTASS
jgi:hypothetical protein